MLYEGTSVTAGIETVVHTNKISTCMKIHTRYEVLLATDCVSESRHSAFHWGMLKSKATHSYFIKGLNALLKQKKKKSNFLKSVL